MTVPEQAYQEADAETILATLGVYDLRPAEITGIIASLILLRWLDQADAEASVEAIFEDRPHQPLFPPKLQWRHWHDAEPLEMAERLTEIHRFVGAGRASADEGPAAHVHLIADSLAHLLQISPVYLVDAVHWVAALPMDTPAEQRDALLVFDDLLAKAASAYDGESTTPPSVVKLMVALADPQPGESVFDPCFGRAGLLIAAWRHAEANRTGRLYRPGPLIDVSGVEINAQTFLIGLTRLVLSGVWSARLALGNSLEREPSRNSSMEGYGADVVLATPPIGAKTQRDKLRYEQFAIVTPDLTGLFVQHALAQLKPQGRAVIAVPDGFLFRSGSERELRRRLIEQGQIEAIIGLPAGVFLPHSGVKSSLLLLNRQGKVDRIRMVDATPYFKPAKGKRPATPIAALTEQLVRSLRDATALPGSKLTLDLPTESEGPEIGRFSRSVWEVSPRDLEAADWDLQPRRRDGGGLSELLSTLQKAMRNQGEVIPLTGVAEVFAGTSIKSLDLRDEPLNEEAPGYLRIRDIGDGKIHKPSSWVDPVVAAGVPSKARLLPADLLFSKSGTIGKTAIVRNGAVGSIAASGLYIIRTRRNRIDPNFLAAYLASAASQHWLAAQKRGTVIQHLNRDALERLPVPLPPLPLQLRAAQQFEEFGTDVIEFLTRSIGGGGYGRLISHLSKLTDLIPKHLGGVQSMPPLGALRQIAMGIRVARDEANHSGEIQTVANWLNGLVDVVRPLQGMPDMPRGPSMFSVAQETEHALDVVLAYIEGQELPQAMGRKLTTRLRDWMRAIASDLAADIKILAQSEVGKLVSGASAEITVSIINESALPLSSFRVVSQPDWGSSEAAFFKERDALALSLRGDTPKTAGVFSLQLRWNATTLDGVEVNGEIQVSFDVVVGESAESTLAIDLGGSPYVTGSPLDPDEGNEVFFGRGEILQRIARQVVAQGNVVLLEGNRRAGKTSILRHLEGKSAVPGWLAVYASLQGAEGAKRVVGVPTEAVFREIAGSIATAVVKLGIETPLPDGRIVPAGGRALGIGKACRAGISIEAPFADFREYLELLLDVLAPKKLSLLLMLDEFDKLQEGIDYGVTSPQVPENIRFLIQTFPRFSAILTGSRRLKRLREEHWSALYGLGTSIQVTALDPENARRVVTEPVKGKLSYSHEAVDRVLALTARQPYLLQCLCNRIFDFAVETKSRAITIGSVDEAAVALVKDNEHFASLWDYAAQGSPIGRYRRQYLLLLLAESFGRGVDIEFGGLQEALVQHGVEIADEALAADLEYLRELDLVELDAQRDSGRYRLAIPLMADWIHQQHDHEVVQRRAMAEAEEENA
jgi:type I restriction enzyme M protein